MSSATYSVILHHLAPGATAASVDHPDVHLNDVSVDHLRELLYSLSMVAQDLSLFDPASPEIRIKSSTENFIVRTRYRKLCFVGYEAQLRGEEHSVAFILITITGTAEAAKAPPPKAAIERTATTGSTAPMPGKAAETPSAMPRWVKIAIAVVIIVACNGVTAWMLLKPARSLAPKYSLLPQSDSEALLAKYAGEFRTGNSEGDRRIVIEPGGALRLAKFGRNLVVIQPINKTVRGGLVDGRTALVTNDPAAILLKDADTIVLFGNTYKRYVP